MKKEIWILIILSLIIVAITGILIFFPRPYIDRLPAGGDGLYILSVVENQKVSSPLKITGYVNGNGWTGFEGQVGIVKLLDKDGNQLGKTAILTAITDWTSPPVQFQTEISFVSDFEQPGTLVFRNENPSGLQENDKEFILPIKIPKIESMQVSVFFNGGYDEDNYDCNKVVAVKRLIPKTIAPARAALEELLLGPTDQESKDFSTSINPGVKIQSLKIENDIAYADFNEQLEFQVGGSCRVSAIRAQIIQTLKQFSTIKDVIISIDGRTEDILQP